MVEGEDEANKSVAQSVEAKGKANLQAKLNLKKLRRTRDRRTYEAAARALEHRVAVEWHTHAHMFSVRRSPFRTRFTSPPFSSPFIFICYMFLLLRRIY